ncbi:MAG TPA: peptide permease [Persephonella sp.]|uniref:Putative lipoprotein n=1 Tax=Persephonella marina (strain DSM 14350 / EX-H1) TaxID=123214 RepID=C0QTE5_PERMH|nr:MULTISPECIES: thioredoxin fold domain-containing protein [Persephonella]ACO04179.1 putative lipoprotein [Persephonella marina EX-H1]HCB70421.1 peptide permease [Persephonella sp.]
MLRVLTAFLIIIGIFTASCQQKTEGGVSEKFKVDPEPVIKEAMKEKKFLILIFESEDCKYCTKLHKEVLNDLDFKQSLVKNKTAIAIINVYGEREVTDPETKQKMNEQALTFAYRVQGYPTIVVFDPAKDYKPIYTIPGYVEKRDFISLLDFLGSNCYQKVQYEKFVENGKSC